MTMTGVFIGFQKRKGLADRPGIPIGQLVRSDSSPVGWAVRSAKGLIVQPPDSSVRCDDF
ncbi:hypothetical protein HanRHA438_Chr14g0632761 [Helianthus annuus]|nr:hypothetical protein HanRHA438_Chr14g0632761 [Helianthus annuus]